MVSSLATFLTDSRRYIVMVDSNFVRSCVKVVVKPLLVKTLLFAYIIIGVYAIQFGHLKLGISLIVIGVRCIIYLDAINQRIGNGTYVYNTTIEMLYLEAFMIYICVVGMIGTILGIFAVVGCGPFSVPHVALGCLMMVCSYNGILQILSSILVGIPAVYAMRWVKLRNQHD